MTNDTNTDRRETVYSALTVAGRGLIMVMVISALLIQPAAAQTNETDPCAVGPPIYGQDPQEEIDELEVAMVSDRSQSMSNDDKLQTLKDASTDFIGRLNDSDEAAAVSWGDTATLDQELTTNHDAVNQSIESLTADQVGQNLDGGINTSTEELTNGTNATDGTTKVMIVSTDAESGNFDDGSVFDAADAAKDQGIIVVTIAIGDNADQDSIQQLATGDLYYNASDPNALDDIFEQITQDISSIDSDLIVETRQLYQPGETHEYTVIERRVTANNQTVREDVTDQASITTTNETILSANETAQTLTAFGDANASTWVRVDATANGSTGCTNVIVSQPTVENLQLVPGIWRIVAVGQDDTLFALLVATLLSVPAARFTSAFGGLAVGQLVMTIGWLAGYVGFGIAAASLFVSLFIGLNLAANTDYVAGGVRR